MAKASASTKKTAKAPVKTATSVKKVAVPVQKKSKGVSNRPFAQGVGRRKSAVARVYLRKGNGQIMINGKSFDDYFTVSTARLSGKASFEAFPMTSGMLADVSVCGGGYAAQAVATQLGIARALLAFDETLRSELSKRGFLSVDSRVKERKKYGQKGARKKFQFTKR